MAVYDDWAVTVDLTIGDVQSAAPSISISSGNNASDVNFLTDVMPSVNNTSSQYYDNGSYSGWMNSSTYCSGSSLTDGGDNVNCSWLCPPWNETEDFSVNAFTPSAFFQVIIYSLYSVVFVLALVGNMVVCAVVFTSIRKWTVTNFFIVNMAAGDILMAFFCIPFTFLPTYVLLYWPFGATMCRIVSFSQAVSVFVSAYTMVAISSDRYLAIVYPLRPRMTRKQAKWIIVAVWLAAFATAMPLLLMSKLIIPENSNWHICSDRYICTEVWADPIQQTQYTTVLLLLQYCFPLAVLVFTYGRIGLEIWGKKTPGEAHQHRDLRLARSKRKMIKMMIIVVFFFAFCWLPFNLLQIIGDQYPGIWTWSKINFVAFACHWLAMSHSAYNPIIYCCFNSKFRQTKGFPSVGRALWLSLFDGERTGVERPNGGRLRLLRRPSERHSRERPWRSRLCPAPTGQHLHDLHRRPQQPFNSTTAAVAAQQELVIVPRSIAQQPPPQQPAIYRASGLQVQLLGPFPASAGIGQQRRSSSSTRKVLLLIQQQQRCQLSAAPLLAVVIVAGRLRRCREQQPLRFFSNSPAEVCLPHQFPDPAAAAVVPISPAAAAAIWCWGWFAHEPHHQPQPIRRQHHGRIAHLKDSGSSRAHLQASSRRKSLISSGGRPSNNCKNKRDLSAQWQPPPPRPSRV
ncbi:RYamide receptor-like isoform X1 [Daphnia pulex]|uniref:RYamide receptor-like isoform X1 n=1 Tax=Daphnia pulex TaxID=6669 RepID=UPI001EDDDD86|nr:RYamide receptor-like isoform X1 [Daphnia pulex]